jgi:tRNA threonylcarbamoyl adenosine modification protein YeaZ
MKHAEKILPVIDRLLKKEKLKIRDIDAFLIGRGPGSFTGLRVGFATLKGFLATCPKPCYGAFSLDIIAAGSAQKNYGNLRLSEREAWLTLLSIVRCREKSGTPKGSARLISLGEWPADPEKAPMPRWDPDDPDR